MTDKCDWRGEGKECIRCTDKTQLTKFVMVQKEYFAEAMRAKLISKVNKYCIDNIQLATIFMVLRLLLETKPDDFTPKLFKMVQLSC